MHTIYTHQTSAHKLTNEDHKRRGVRELKRILLVGEGNPESDAIGLKNFKKQ